MAPLGVLSLLPCFADARARREIFTFVGLALDKETYSDFDMDELRRLMPVQNRSAAFDIANVCRRVLEKD